MKSLWFTLAVYGAAIGIVLSMQGCTTHTVKQITDGMIEVDGVQYVQADQF